MTIWETAEHFHWPLEYVKNMALEDLHEWMQIVDGRTSGQIERQRREKFLHGKKRR